MNNSKELKSRIFASIKSLADDESVVISDETPLIGDGSLLDSMNLVELCLSLEDLASDYKFSFDWTSETAMSKSRSMFRTAGSIASEFMSQMESKK